MNILHITDFHYSPESVQQKKVISSIITTLKEQKIDIDLVYFTGDLVQNGNKIENFHEASNELFEKIITELNVIKSNIIFCPGNHDINRNAIHGAIKAFIDQSINSEKELNTFYRKNNDPVFIDCQKPSENYYKFLSEFHKSNELNIISDLYSIHNRRIGEKLIATVCLNSAWLSAIDKDKNGKNDKGNLLFPTYVFEEIKKQINTVDKKILLIHHPLYFFKDYNFYGIEKYIHNEFDLLFSGHVHKISALTRYSGSNGIFEHVAKASLSSKETLGCSLVEIDDIEENVIKVRELTFIEDSEVMHLGNEIIHSIPCGKEKAEMISFRKRIFDKVAFEKENANDLLLLNDVEDNCDFLTLYNHPVIKKEAEGNLDSKTSPIINLEELISGRKNYLVLGKDKCGKTSLLKRIQLEFLANYSRIGKVPFYFDVRDYETKVDKKFNFEKLIKTYFVISNSKVNEILGNNNFVFLIDNYSPDSSLVNNIDAFFTKYNKVSFVITTELNLSRTVDIFQFGGLICDKVYFHDLRRQEIIKYTDQRLSKNQKKEEIQEKIIQLCKQIELPLNYWTVSLLLLIHNKSSDSYSKNLFSILDVCIEEIFDKKHLAFSHTRLNFEHLKKICAELAKELFVNHIKTTYSASYNVILTQIEFTISENNRISANPKDVLDFLIESGIIKKKVDSNLYVFRLNGFFEYFLALQMTKDSEFKTEILEDDVKFLAFKNQLEIYSGFKRDDFEFLSTIFNKSKSKLQSVFEIYSMDKDKELLEKINEPTAVEKFCKETSISKVLTSSEKAIVDDLVDELSFDSEVHEIKKLNPEDINSELIERYISITARVFRNMDGVSGNKEKISEMFNEIIDWYCDFGFFIIDEFTKIARNEIINEEFVDFQNFPELDLLKFISNFSPLISQTWLNDGLGHYNLERLIKEELTKLDAEKNQYKLFLLYFLLLDIDLMENRKYLQESMNKITMPILKYAVFLKLNYYLAFKSGKNSQLQQDLSVKIQKAKVNFESKTELGEIQKQIQAKKRINLRNKNL